ncbi:MAG: spore coat protein U domain-containing protein [Rhodobacteraceae bacterium]|nr:spore coat protein U domain-containing protein [Paracoccaceae bacterium]
MKHTFKFISIAAAGLAISTVPVVSATKTAVLSVSATVDDTCYIAAAPGLAFGTIDGSAVTNETVAGEITVSCTTAKTGLTLTMGGSANKSGTQRRMFNGLTGYLPYAIHSDSSHTTEVGIDEQFGSAFAVTAGAPQTFSVYGQVPAGDYVQGVYTDTITVTLTY